MKRPTPPPGTLVLLRHAQSVWNVENRFSGWADVALSEFGIEEARRAGAQLRRQGFADGIEVRAARRIGSPTRFARSSRDNISRDGGFVFDLAFVSRLQRARHTLDLVLDELHQTRVPVGVSWRLNERHYGALQGLDKAETAARYGAEQFQRWRRGYRDTPPALAADDPRHPHNDPVYADVPPELLPATESLADTERRVVPYWEGVIAPQLAAGKTVLVVAHGNTLRALVMHLEGLTIPEVERLEIATATPLIYRPDHVPARDARLAQAIAPV